MPAAACLLIIGALEDGTKELIAVHAGYRESELSWREIMVNLKNQGLNVGPKLAIGDGALGFWSALRKEFPETREQRCWVHLTANVLDKMPKSVQKNAKQMIYDIYLAPTKEEAEKAFKAFVDLYQAKYPKAVACLIK
ncbi:MAG: transposase, partial [Elusimicrobiota bacterium]